MGRNRLKEYNFYIKINHANSSNDQQRTKESNNQWRDVELEVLAYETMRRQTLSWTLNKKGTRNVAILKINN